MPNSEWEPHKSVKPINILTFNKSRNGRKASEGSSSKSRCTCPSQAKCTMICEKKGCLDIPKPIINANQKTYSQVNSII